MRALYKEASAFEGVAVISMIEREVEAEPDKVEKALEITMEDGVTLTVELDSGEKRLNDLGYKQELKRDMVRRPTPFPPGAQHQRSLLLLLACSRMPGLSSCRARCCLGVRQQSTAAGGGARRQLPGSPGSWRHPPAGEQCLVPECAPYPPLPLPLPLHLPPPLPPPLLPPLLLLLLQNLFQTLLLSRDDDHRVRGHRADVRAGVCERWPVALVWYWWITVFFVHLVGMSFSEICVVLPSEPPPPPAPSSVHPAVRWKLVLYSTVFFVHLVGMSFSEIASSFPVSSPASAPLRPSRCTGSVLAIGLLQYCRSDSTVEGCDRM